MADNEYPRLLRPPLREALIDIRLADTLPANFIEKLPKLDLAGFARLGEIREGAFQLEVPADKAPQATVTSSDLLGRRFDNANRSQAVQFRRNGMTLSILKDYGNWETLRDGARGFWQRFLDLSGPTRVGRLAVRYINVTDVPFGEDFDNYLTAMPRIPKGLPQLLNSFFQRIAVPFSEDEALAIITQALELPPKEERSSVVLDIDVSSQVSMGGNDPGIWDKLERLRIIKNRIFFSSLTERALEAYR